MSTENSRKHRRLDIELPVVVTTREGRRVRRAENLSFGGMQIAQGVGSLDDGALIKLQFRIPECPLPIECEAEVVHRTRDRLGVRFTKTALFEMAAIARHVMDRARN